VSHNRAEIGPQRAANGPNTPSWFEINAFSAYGQDITRLASDLAIRRFRIPNGND
jgi:hypothetical protein